VTADQAKRALAAPPAPNPMGRDRFQITERRLIQGDPAATPVLVVTHRSDWKPF